VTPPPSYDQLARRLAERAFITDPWLDGGGPRFDAAPVVLSAETYRALATAAEDVAGVLDEMCRIVAASPALLDEFFRLTPVQQLLFQTSFPLWHGHARADVFLRPSAPPVVCEINCDTPSGQPEAVALGREAAGAGASVDGAVADGPIDPTAGLPRALAGLLAGAARRLVRGAHPPAAAAARPAAVGIVYPTEMPEDLALITLVRGALEARGHEVVLGSPFNLHATPGGGVGLFGRPVDVVMRHYKTDWWGERLPLWRDEAPFPDPEPLAGPLRLLLEAELRGRCAVVNPFGAVLPQNKRSYAFLWERRQLFSAAARAVIDTHVPRTVRLEAARLRALADERERWVLKSDYGCEGEEVLIGAMMTAAEWRQALAMAIPQRWIAQERFEGTRDAAGRTANHGIFLVAGRAAGVYTRLAPDLTDRQALSVPTLVAA
jgi:hypothetical protein